MSVYIQEVLGLLKRNKKKKKLDKMRDHFEFGKLYSTSHLNTGAAYNPKMEPFVVKWGDLVCEATEDLTRTQPGSGNLGFVPVYTTPEGSCAWDTLMDSIITQNAIGDTITINNGNLIVDLQLTAGSANILDLTEDRIVIVGPNGELEDDPNFTMDGVTFTALVNVQHGSPVVAPAVPATTTTINSSIVLNGPVYDSQGNLGQASQVLVGLADGRVIWHDDDVVEYLTYGSLWQGDPNNLKQELPIGTPDQILISDGTTFAWQDNPAAIIGEACSIYRIPLYTPNPNTLGCSLLLQDGDSSTPASKVINEGNLENQGDALIQGNVEINGTTKLDTLANDDTLTQVLVRDPADDNLLKWRDALSIVPELGWDTVPYDQGIADWDVVKYNGYMIVDQANPPATRAIRPNNLTNAEEGYFVFVCEVSDLPLDFLQFTGVNGSNPTRVRTTWSGSGNNVYTPTAQAGGFWQYGTAVKFHYIVRDEGGVMTIWWDACCEIKAQNECPVGTPTSFTTLEDTTTGQLGLPATDDGIGTLAWSIVQQPLDSDGVTSAGTINLDPATGQYTFTPALNYYGSGTFTWEVTDGYCASDVITVNFTVTAVAESPVFQVYNGAGAACGAASVPPVYTGTVGGSYVYEGHYCDPDHNYTQVSLTAEHSTTGAGGPWTSGLPANFALVKDELANGTPTPWRFAFTSSSVPSGQTCFRLTLQDPDGNSNQQIFCVSAAFDILQNMQFQLDYEAQLAPAGSSRTPVASTDNLGEWSAQQTVENITVTGFTLNNPTTAPTGLPNPTNNVAGGISPSGGTYPNALTSTFTLYVYNGEIGAVVDTIPNNSNISVGDTIIFDQNTLDVALPTTAPHNNDLIFTIVEEDIKFAPNSQSSIPLVQTGAQGTGHNCNDGGFALVFRVTDTNGDIQTFKSRRFNCSNTGTSAALSVNKFSLPSYNFTNEYITQGVGSGNNSPVWWNRSRPGGPYAIAWADVDQTDGGRIGDKRNFQQSALPGYYTNGFNYGNNSRTSGLFRLPDALIQQMAAASGNGIVTAKIVGDTWFRASGAGGGARVTSVDANGAITGLTLTSGGSNYSLGNSSPTTGYVMLSGGNGSGGFAFVTQSAGVITQVAPWNIHPGSGYQVNDLLTLDGNNTAHARTHGDAAGMRVFREDPLTPGSHIEIGIDPNTGRSLVVGDGTEIQIDLFNNTVTVV